MSMCLSVVVQYKWLSISSCSITNDKSQRYLLDGKLGGVKDHALVRQRRGLHTVRFLPHRQKKSTG